MEASQRKAIAILTADEPSRGILRYFSEAMPLRTGQTFSDVEHADRFKVFADSYKAFHEHRQEYLSLLVEALPGFDPQYPVKSVLESPVEHGDTVYWFEVPTLESIPEPFRGNARSLPDGRYRITGGADLRRAMGEEKPGEKKPVEKPVADPAKFEISRTVVANDFAQFLDLRQKAEAAGQRVVFVD